MTRTHRRSLFAGGVPAACALSLLAETAAAAGFQLAEQNASGLGSVFAGQAALSDDASAVYFNPAALTRVSAQRQFVAAGHWVRTRSRFVDAGSCAPYAGTGVGTATCPFGPGGNLGHALGGDSGKVGESAFVPNVYMSWALGGDFVAGFGFNAPFGLANDRDPSWMGRFHSVQADTRALNFNPTLAWKTGSFAVGFGLNAQRFDAEIANVGSYRAVALASGNAALIAAVPAGAEGLVTVKGDDWGSGWNAGVHVALPQGLDLGVAYRSKVRYQFRGSVRFADRPAALGAVPQVADGAVRADIELPDMLSLALAWKIGDFKLMADWTRTGWDSIQDFTILRADGPLDGQTFVSVPLRFRNSQRVGIGTAYQLPGQRWTLRTGVARETSPVRSDTRLPLLADSSRWWLGLGARYHCVDAPRAFDIGVAWVRNDKAPIAARNQFEAGSPPRGSLVGTYRSAGAVVVGVQGLWDF